MSGCVEPGSTLVHGERFWLDGSSLCVGASNLHHRSQAVLSFFLSPRDLLVFSQYRRSCEFGDSGLAIPAARGFATWVGSSLLWSFCLPQLLNMTSPVDFQCCLETVSSVLRKIDVLA